MAEYLTCPGLLVRRDLALSSISLRAGRQQVSARYTTCEGEVSSMLHAGPVHPLLLTCMPVTIARMTNQNQRKT